MIIRERSSKAGIFYVTSILGLLGVYSIKFAYLFGKESLSCQSLRVSRWPLIATETRTDPKFNISLPTKKEDPLRFEIINSGIYYEEALTHFICAMVIASSQQYADNVVAFDVGCNAGWYSLYTAALFRRNGWLHSRVVCFEANPNLLPRLRDSIALNDGFSQTVIIEKHALSDSNGAAMLSWRPGHYGGGSLAPPVNAEVTESSRVETMTLDSYLSYNPAADKTILFLKIDVEGYECLVLRGARNLLRSRRVQNIFVELTFYLEESLKCKAEEWIPALIDLGYEVRTTYDPSTPSVTKADVFRFINETKHAVNGSLPYRDLWFKLTTHF